MGDVYQSKIVPVLVCVVLVHSVPVSLVSVYSPVLFSVGMSYDISV